MKTENGFANFRSKTLVMWTRKKLDYNKDFLCQYSKSFDMS